MNLTSWDGLAVQTRSDSGSQGMSYARVVLSRNSTLLVHSMKITGSNFGFIIVHVHLAAHACCHTSSPRGMHSRLHVCRCSPTQQSSPCKPVRSSTSCSLRRTSQGCASLWVAIFSTCFGAAHQTKRPRHQWPASQMWVLASTLPCSTKLHRAPTPSALCMRTGVLFHVAPALL